MTSFKRTGTLALAVVLLVVPVMAQTPARDTPRFVGTWRLVSETTTGMMIYDNLGNMAAQVMPNRAAPQVHHGRAHAGRGQGRRHRLPGVFRYLLS